MALTTRERTHRLLRRYFTEGKPRAIRDEVLRLNERLIGWIAKHYKVDGIVEYADLKQEATLAILQFIEDTLRPADIEYYNRRFFWATVTACSRYKYHRMGHMSGEARYLKQNIDLYWQHQHQGKEYLSDNALDNTIGDEYNALYNYDCYHTDAYLGRPSYFADTVEPDTLPAAEPPTTIEEQRRIFRMICRNANLSRQKREALELYIFDTDSTGPYACHGFDANRVYEQLSWQEGVSIGAITLRRNKAIGDLQDYIEEWQQATDMHYLTDLTHLLAYQTIEARRKMIERKTHPLNTYLDKLGLDTIRTKARQQ